MKDKNIGRKIVAAADAPAPRLVIEIGPGQGALTDLLLASGDPYIGIEIDPNLATFLNDKFADAANFRLIATDVLSVDFARLIQDYPGYRVVVIGNIPYNITSPILFKLFDISDLLDSAVIMMQKEVAQRLKASPNSKEYGLLAINTQLFSQVSYLFTVPAKLFFPPPKVNSAVIKMVFKKEVLSQFENYANFKRVLRHCFQHRRKMLRKSLSMLFPKILDFKLETDLTKRPEHLTIPEWTKLTDAIYKQAAKEAK